MRADVSAVLVAWNAGETLRACADSLRDAAHEAGARLQLVIVDNASTDDAVAKVSLDDGDVLIRNPVNAGYGVAASQGLNRCAAEWALLANPDLVVGRDFFVHLLAAARNAPADVATLVPEMRYALSRETINCRGVTVDELGVPAEVDAGMDVGVAPSSTAPLGGSSGCCLLRLETVRRVGGLEVVFFAYLEDVDLAIRLARAGCRSRLVPQAIAWHEGSAATGQTSPLKTFLVARNRRLLFALEGPRSPWRRLRRSVVELGHATVSSAFGSLAAPWRGRLDALRLRRYVRFVRRSRAACDERNVSPQFTPRVSISIALRRKRAVMRAARR